MRSLLRKTREAWERWRRRPRTTRIKPSTIGSSLAAETQKQTDLHRVTIHATQYSVHVREADEWIGGDSTIFPPSPGLFWCIAESHIALLCDVMCYQSEPPKSGQQYHVFHPVWEWTVLPGRAMGRSMLQDWQLSFTAIMRLGRRVGNERPDAIGPEATRPNTQSRSLCHPPTLIHGYWQLEVPTELSDASRWMEPTHSAPA